MKKNILSIVGILVGLIMLVVLAIIVKSIADKENEKSRMNDLLESNVWERLNNETFEMEYIHDLEGGYEILDYNEFHMLVEIEDEIVDYVLGMSYTNAFNNYLGENSFDIKVKELLQGYTACYDIKNMSNDKIEFGLPAMVDDYDKDDTDEVKMAEYVEYAKLQLIDYSNYYNEGCIQVLNESDAYMSITKEEAKEEIKTEGTFEFLWYNEKLEVEKIVFCNIDKKELSLEESQLQEAIGSESWYRQTYKDIHLQDTELFMYCDSHFLMTSEEGIYKSAKFTIDYDNWVLKSEYGDISVVDYSDWNLTLKYNNEFFDFTTEYYFSDSLVINDVNKDYFEGYTGKFTVLELVDNKLTIAPSVYKDSEEYYEQYIEDRIVTDDIVFEEVIMANSEELVSYNQLSKEDVIKKLEEKSCFAYFWYNANMEIEKLVFYEVLDVTTGNQLSLQEFLSSQNWYRVNGGHECGANAMMLFSKYDGFAYCCTCGETIGDSNLYSTYAVVPGTQKINLSGFKETTMEVLLCNEYHIIVNFEGKILDFMSEKMCSAVPKIYSECSAYLDEYSGVYMFDSYNEGVLRIGPPNYDAESGLNNYLDEVKVAENVICQRVTVIETNSSVGETDVEVFFEGLSKEEIANEINTDGSFGFIWYNEDFEVTKIVLYGTTEIYE